MYDAPFEDVHVEGEEAGVGAVQEEASGHQGLIHGVQPDVGTVQIRRLENKEISTFRNTLVNPTDYVDPDGASPQNSQSFEPTWIF